MVKSSASNIHELTDPNIYIFFSGSWKNKTFKQYNFDALGVQPQCGHLHPLMKVGNLSVGISPFHDISWWDFFLSLRTLAEFLPLHVF